MNGPKVAVPLVCLQYNEMTIEVTFRPIKELFTINNVVETTTDTSGDNDTLGEFEIEFEVTAVEGDFYIRELATEGTSATTGVEFTVDGTSATTSGTLSSTADEDTAGVFTVREGETETFTLRVTVNPDASGDFRVNLTGVNYAENSNGFYVTAGTDGDLYVPTPAQDFRTSYETIQGS